MVCLPFHYSVEIKMFKPYIDVAYGTIFSQTCFVRFTLSTWFDLISGNATASADCTEKGKARADQIKSMANRVKKY